MVKDFLCNLKTQGINIYTYSENKDCNGNLCCNGNVYQCCCCLWQIAGPEAFGILVALDSSPFLS